MVVVMVILVEKWRRFRRGVVVDSVIVSGDLGLRKWREVR